MCEKSVEVKGWTLRFETLEMFNKATEENLWSMTNVPDCLKTQEICKRVVEKDPYTLKFAPDQYTIPEMCERVVEGDLQSWTLNCRLSWY